MKSKRGRQFGFPEVRKGFVFVEFAISLPLLILVLYGLAIVSVKIFSLSKEQLADYVLESEAQYVMELITSEVRVAKEVDINNESNKIKIVYHVVDDWKNGNAYFTENFFDAKGGYYLYGDRDVLETRYIYAHIKNGRAYPNLYAQRQASPPTSPITGENSFGDTKVNSLKCELVKSKKILRIELEMESLVTEHKIKIETAVFMPNYEGD